MTIQFNSTIVFTAIGYTMACQAGIYACQYLCQKPNVEGRVQTVFDRFRECCAKIKNSISHCIGENWSLFCEAVFKYAWLGILFDTVLALINPILTSQLHFIYRVQRFLLMVHFGIFLDTSLIRHYYRK